MSVAPVPRPVASASYSFVRFLGGGLAPWISGVIGEAFLPNTPFWVAAVVVALGMLVLSTAHRLLRRAETEEPSPAPAPERGGSAELERPVLVAVDDAPHTDAVIAAGARLARAVDAPVLLVHVPEDALVGDATPVGDDPGILTGRVAELTASGLAVAAESLHPVASHDAVGLALADLARRRDARAVVVGSPHGGPLAALARPSADRGLWEHADRPVVVIPAGMAGGVVDAVPAEPNVPSAAGALTGRVRDHAGHPVDAVLTLVDGGGHQVARGATDTGGGYRLPVGPASGSGLLVVRGRDGRSAPAVVPVVLGAPAVHDVELGTGASRARGASLVAGS
jgi:nucleotide-binding universal stress UspA family protein